MTVELAVAGPGAGAVVGADLAGSPAGRRIVCVAPAGSPCLALVAAYAAGRPFAPTVASSWRVAVRLVRSPPPPAAVVVEWPGGRGRAAAGAASQSEAEALCRRLKGDPFTATVPLVALTRGGARFAEEAVAAALEAGADEALAAHLSRREKLLRLDRTLRRSRRDLAVHPATRLPGAPEIGRRLAEEIAAGRSFALCHADLDHFKEYNDRYGPAEGDKTILLVASILRDVARALAPVGFVGHVGGDDFVLLTTPEQAARCCDEIVRVFGEAAPLRYDHADRRAGGFAARDRWGSVRRIPLMTLSIGVAAGPAGSFASPSQVLALAGRMKGRAKRSPGNAWLAGRHEPGGLSYFSQSMLALRRPATTPGEKSAEAHGNRAGTSPSLRPSAPRRPRAADRGASGVPLTSTGAASESKLSTPKWRPPASGTTRSRPGG